MSDVFENPAVQAPAHSRPAAQQRYLVLALMLFSLVLGIGIGAVVTRGALADPDNRITLTSNGVTADSLSAAFAHASELVEPCVVSIDTREGGRGDFARAGKGSGVIVTETGYIVTNFHVVEDAGTITVRLADRRQFNGKVIGRDRETDLAVVKIEADRPLPFARFGDSDRLRVGDWVLAIGSPFGLEQTVTAGIISARERETEAGSSPFQKFLQTDAAINPGNSGGPLVNLAGEVIGINTQIATRTGVFSGIGLALPSRTTVEVYNQLITSGRVGRGFLGIKIGDISDEIAQRNGLDTSDGVLVTDLSHEESPAGKAGIRGGDIIIELDGQPVKDGRELIRRVGAMPVGSVVRLTYVRDGQPGSATVKLTDRETGLETSRSNELPSGPPRPPFGFDDEEPGLEEPDLPAPDQPGPQGIGLALRTLTPDLARDRNLEGVTGALVLDVEPGSPAARAGLGMGDVIVSAEGQRIESEQNFADLLADSAPGEKLVLSVARRSGTRIERRFVTITVP
jgi:serine protease Do